MRSATSSLRGLSLLLALLVLAPVSLRAQTRPQPSPEVRALLDRGVTEEKQGRRDNAAGLYGQALELARKGMDRPGEAGALLGLGRAIVFAKPLESITHFEQALFIYRQLQDRRGEADCHLLLGSACQITSQAQKALDYFASAGRMFEELGERSAYASTLSNAATVYIRTGRPDRALDLLLRALAIYEERGTKDGILGALGNLGATYSNLRDIPKALEVLERAQAMARELGRKGDEAIISLNLGLAHNRISGPRKALESFDRAVSLLDGSGDRRTLAAVLTSMAQAHEQDGDLFKALETSQRALDIHRSVGDRNGVARTLGNLGTLHELVGENTAALEYYQQALQAGREASDLLAQMTTLTQMGRLYGTLGRREQEQDCYQQSLRLHQNDTYRDARAGTLFNLAGALMDAGKYPEALDRAGEAGALYRGTGDPAGQGWTELRMGRLQERLGKTQETRTHYEAALKLFRDLNDLTGEAAAAGALAGFEEAQRRPDQAAEHYTRALALLELGRESLGRLTEAKVGYLERQVPVYQRYTRFLLETGQNARAFEWVEKARGRALADLMDSGKVDISRAMTEADRKQEQDLKRREKVLAQKWLAVSGLLQELQRQAQPDRARQGQAKGQAEEVQRQQQQVEREWRAFRDGLYLRNPLLAQQRAAAVVGLQDAAALLPPDTALLEYSIVRVGQGARERDEVALFVLTRAAGRPALKVFRAAAAGGSVSRLVAQFREACAGRPGSPDARPYQAVSRQLYRLLIAPAAAALAGKQRLIVCPDGPLWDVPFQALLAADPPSGRSGRKAAPAFLWERFAISYSYSATGMKAALGARSRPGRPRPERSLLVLADPSRPQPGTAGPLTRAGGLGPLPSARVEARSIASFFPDATLKLADDAQETLVKQAGPGYRHLHFAAHALFNDAAPLLSGIVLARPPKDSPEDGILTARELFEMSLAADTVVLSACDTARGAKRRGEGVVGLTWAMFVAGVPTQVVSQWSVDDAATSQLMGGFYRGLKQGRSRDAALRASALTLLRDGKHSHPFYWAPFLVMGDWR